MRPSVNLGFSAANNNSFVLKFENGFSVSVAWGKNAYCDRYEFGQDPSEDRKERFVTSPNAEVAVIFNGVFMCWGPAETIGSMTPDQVATIISIVQGVKPDDSKLLDELAESGVTDVVHSGPLEIARLALIEAGLAHPLDDQTQGLRLAWRD